MYDEAEGLNFQVGLRAITETFGDPEWAADRQPRQIVLRYLQEQSLHLSRRPGADAGADIEDWHYWVARGHEW